MNMRSDMLVPVSDSMKFRKELKVHYFTLQVGANLEKPGILGELSELGKLMEFSGNSVQPQGIIITN